MNVTVLDRSPDSSAQTQLGYVDCDVHIYPSNRRRSWTRSCRSAGASIARIDRRAHTSGVGEHGQLSAHVTRQVGMRLDSWPPNGRHPRLRPAISCGNSCWTCSVRSYGMMLPLVGRCSDERNVEFGAAMCTAVNDWQAANWSDPNRA